MSVRKILPLCAVALLLAACTGSAVTPTPSDVPTPPAADSSVSSVSADGTVPQADASSSSQADDVNAPVPPAADGQ